MRSRNRGTDLRAWLEDELRPEPVDKALFTARSRT